MASLDDWAALVREAIAANDVRRFLALVEELRAVNPAAADEFLEECVTFRPAATAVARG